MSLKEFKFTLSAIKKREDVKEKESKKLKRKSSKARLKGGRP